MREFYFSLSITADELMRYYRGSAQQVVARAQDGRCVQFPASALRPFVTHEGVRGEFCLVVDDNNRLVELRRI